MSIIEDVAQFFKSKLRHYKISLNLVKLESELARLSIFPMLASLIFFLVCLAIIWIILMLGIGMFIYHLTSCWMMVIAGLFVINAVGCLISFYCLKKHVKRMTFSQTRSLLHKYRNLKNHDVKK